jgi:hypothetical protein
MGGILFWMEASNIPASQNGCATKRIFALTPFCVDMDAIPQLE